jgi:ADP-ribosylglycohydrolase
MDAIHRARPALAHLALLSLLIALAPPALRVSAEDVARRVEIPAAELRDKIRGGLLGQILGNLNGLPHEMKYIEEPGSVTDYTPALPEGARTDDDTDFEWVYIAEMQLHDTILLPPARIAELWKTRINKRIWCSNQYARQLMDLGLVPPLTGKFALNPWADFNISGQFLCETFGLLAPAMPETASRIALNYTTVAIDLEPAQTTQLFTAMIATAFVTADLEGILDAGLAAIDSQSRLHEIVGDVRRWHEEHPDDWRASRRLVKEKYSKHAGAMRDRNGYELNTASTIAALLYGRGDFASTLMTAFNFGWDADNTAATAGTIIGVVKGYRWMLSRGWNIVDRYRNTTRENMPEDETITSFADRLIDLAERVIVGRGGERVRIRGELRYRIAPEEPRNVLPLARPEVEGDELRRTLRTEIEAGVAGDSSADERARSAYLAICLDLGEELRERHPEGWRRAIAALESRWNVVQAIFHHADVPAGEDLRRKAAAAGLRRPETAKPLW